MSILITGGAGFIGSHTAVEFLNAGYDIVVVDNYCNSSPKALERIKETNRPTESAPFDYDRSEGTSAKSTDAVADEISANLQALVGTTEDIAPKAEPRHPVSESTTSKFANLQFGRNYDHGTGRIG